MRDHSRIAFAGACVGLLIASAPALSTPLLTREQMVDRMTAAQKPVTGWPALVIEARKYMGTNPTDRKQLWCATFMNFILARIGYSGTNSDAAKSFAYYGQRISKPRIGAIAVLTRGPRGGHVGVVSGIDSHGNPIIISGNHNDRVGEGVYPRARVIAYVMPTGKHRPTTTQLAARSLARIPDKGIDSPITELIAAIEAEHARGERQRVERQRAAARNRLSAHRRIAQRPPARKQIVQQLPSMPSAQPPRPRARDNSASPLEPLLTKLFGPDDRVQARPQYRARLRQAPARHLAINGR